eukprot:COSAG01_NODE_585_length_15160_cov_15.779473_2_plen_92_part_00
MSVVATCQQNIQQENDPYVAALVLVAPREANWTPAELNLLFTFDDAIGDPFWSGNIENSTTMEPVTIESILTRLLSIPSSAPISLAKFSSE